MERNGEKSGDGNEILCWFWVKLFSLCCYSVVFIGSAQLTERLEESTDDGASE